MAKGKRGGGAPLGNDNAKGKGKKLSPSQQMIYRRGIQGAILGGAAGAVLGTAAGPFGTAAGMVAGYKIGGNLGLASGFKRVGIDVNKDPNTKANKNLLKANMKKYDADHKRKSLTSAPGNAKSAKWKKSI